MDEQQVNEEQVKELENKCAEYLSGWQRAKADYENLAKDLSQQVGAAAEMAQARVVLEALPLYDHFKLAISHIPEDQKKADWVKGLLHIKKAFEDFLKNLEIAAVPAVGENFDPAKHEAVGEEESDQSPGTIVKEIKAGYQFKDKVIAPAQVIIAKSLSENN